jgi:hypothetical protein
MRFEKGQSGNPGGRPKGDGEIRELARQHTPTALRTLIEIAEHGEMRVPALLRQTPFSIAAMSSPLSRLSVTTHRRRSSGAEVCGKACSSFPRRELANRDP